jgi:serine/threonine protein kinase
MSASTLSPKQKIGAYLLLEKLGKGGLGEVWKARDPRLNRIVALKFLTLEQSGSSSPHDLLREARAASALNHPNIITIFEVGESEGQPFLAMEFVEGETLRTRLNRPSLPMEEALKIAEQVIEGLAAAHRIGVVHRDLKPENIFLRVDGFVKLLDFGLAKILPWGRESTAEFSPASGITESGAIMGTFAYMSPEQARGQPVRPTSDVFSLGIVLFEMLAGEHPFEAETSMDTLSAILSREAPVLHLRAPRVPRELSEICSRALEKDASKRYASAIDVREEFKRAVTSATSAAFAQPPTVRHKPRWMQAIGAGLLALLLGLAGWWYHSPSQGGGPSAPVRSVAVMNFHSEEGDQQAQILARDLPEELTNALSKVGLQVASHASVTELGPSARSREVGAQLSVEAVIEGSVRSFGAKSKVNVELLDARTGFLRWSSSFTTEGEDPLGSEQKVAEDIAMQLRTALAAPK